MQKINKKNHFTLLLRFTILNLLAVILLFNGCAGIGENEKKFKKERYYAHLAPTTLPTPKKSSAASYNTNALRSSPDMGTNMISQFMSPQGATGEKAHKGVKTFDAPYDKVFHAVLGTIEFKEYPIHSQNLEKGIIESDYRMHDGLFTMGFMGGKVRSKMLSELVKLDMNTTRVTLRVKVEKETKSGGWVDFPIAPANFDLVDTDSYEILFYYVLERINPKDTPEAKAEHTE